MTPGKVPFTVASTQRLEQARAIQVQCSVNLPGCNSSGWCQRQRKDSKFYLLSPRLLVTYVEARSNTGTGGKYRELRHQEELESQGKPEQLSPENYPGDEGEGRGEGGKLAWVKGKWEPFSRITASSFTLTIFLFRGGWRRQREDLKQAPGPAQSSIS